MTERKENDTTTIKRRIEACVMQAQTNARNFGGDNATAAGDLMCAFVLISVHEDGDLWLKSGGSTVIMTPAEWSAAVAAVGRAMQAFALLSTPAQPPEKKRE